MYNETKARFYCFNGLYVKSEIPISEVQEYSGSDLSGNPVTIRYGNVPHSLEQSYFSNSVISISENEVLIYIEGVARYYIRGNSEVVIEPCEGATIADVRLYILSIVLGVLLHKNNILALHASSIKIGNEAVLIAGQSGVGKSTLALGLYRKGYEVINDDITSVFFDSTGKPYVYTGVQHLKLWGRSLEKYGYDTIEFERLKTELEKYSFPINRTTIAPVPVKAIYILKEWNEDGLDSKSLSGLEKFQKIKANTYRYKLVQHLQKTQNHFTLASQLANEVPVIKICRPADVSPADFSEYMQGQFDK